MKKISTLALVAMATLFSFTLVNAQSVQAIGYTPDPDTAIFFPTLIDCQYPASIEWSIMREGEVVPIKWATVQLNSAQEGFMVYGLEGNTTYQLGITVNGNYNGYYTTMFTTDATTGISKALSDATRIIATGKTLQVTIPQEFLGKAVTVVTMSGQAVLTQTLNETMQRIELPELPSGVYLVSLDGNITKKVILRD